MHMGLGSARASRAAVGAPADRMRATLGQNAGYLAGARFFSSRRGATKGTRGACASHFQKSSKAADDVARH
jgi:hypothetical protein